MRAVLQYFNDVSKSEQRRSDQNSAEEKTAEQSKSDADKNMVKSVGNAEIMRERRKNRQEMRKRGNKQRVKKKEIKRINQQINTDNIKNRNNSCLIQNIIPIYEIREITVPNLIA